MAGVVILENTTKFVLERQNWKIVFDRSGDSLENLWNKFHLVCDLMRIFVCIDKGDTF